MSSVIESWAIFSFLNSLGLQTHGGGLQNTARRPGFAKPCLRFEKSRYFPNERYEFKLHVVHGHF